VADASDRDETYCADHALDSFDIDELYAVTKDSDAAAEISAFLAADRQDRADFERESREGGIGR
jgi:hypothetical protein